MKIVQLEKVTNRIILEMTPVDSYAEIFDQKVSAFFSESIDWLERASREEMKKEFDISFLRNWSDEYLEEHKQELLIYVFATFFNETDFVQSDYVQAMSDDEFECYNTYLCFFGQYRIVTGENLSKGMSCSDILRKYKTLGEDFLNKYVYTDNYVPGKGRLYSWEYAIPIRDDRIDEFEKAVDGLDLYVTEYHKKKFDIINSRTDKVAEIEHLSSCDAFNYYMDRDYTPEWEPVNLPPVNESHPFLESVGSKRIFLYQITELMNIRNDYTLNGRLKRLYLKSEETSRNNKIMFFASCYFDKYFYNNFPFSKEFKNPFEILNANRLKKIRKRCEFHLSVVIKNASEDLAVLSDKNKKLKVISDLDAKIGPILRRVVVNVSDSDIPEFVAYNCMEHLTDFYKKCLLFDVYSSKDMQYILLNQYRLKKDKESFRKILFCICHEVSFMFSEDTPNYGFDESRGFIDIYINTVNKVVSYYQPLFDAIDNGVLSREYIKVDNPYSIDTEFEMISLYVGELYKSRVKQSDNLIAQEHIFICARLFDIFSAILSINMIMMEDIMKENVFVSSDYYREIRTLSSNYRHFFTSMIDHVFNNYILADQYVETQNINRINEEENKNENKKHLNLQFQSVMELLEVILDTDLQDPQEIAEYRMIILKTLAMMDVDYKKTDEFIDRLVLKLLNKDTSDTKFKKTYDNIARELYSLHKNVDESIIKTLATAEYFYSIYIDEKSEIENFDYSCFSILYYRCFEDALNSIIYLPYRKEYEETIIEQYKKLGTNNNGIDLVPAGVNGLVNYSKKSDSYYLAERLTLGGLAFFIRGITKSNNGQIRQWLSNRCKNINKLCQFSDEVLEISKKRNLAAHGSNILPAQSLIDSKNYVFNKMYSQRLKNMLIRFMQIMNNT